jgi:hypothetical protein
MNITDHGEGLLWLHHDMVLLIDLFLKAAPGTHLGYACLGCPPRLGASGLFLLDHSVIVQDVTWSRSHVKLFLFKNKTGVQVSRFLFGRDGVNCPDACLIHTSIRVPPGWWVGYLKLLPWG